MTNKYGRVDSENNVYVFELGSERIETVSLELVVAVRLIFRAVLVAQGDPSLFIELHLFGAGLDLAAVAPCDGDRLIEREEAAERASGLIACRGVDELFDGELDHLWFPWLGWLSRSRSITNRCSFCKDD